MPVWLVLFIAMLTVGGCAHVKPIEYPDRTVSTAIEEPASTSLGRKAARITAGRPPDASGFLLLDKGEEALLWRGVLADRATHTIDATGLDVTPWSVPEFHTYFATKQRVIADVIAVLKGKGPELRSLEAKQVGSKPYWTLLPIAGVK